MLKRIVKNRWFAITELILVLLCGMIWYFRPDLSWRLLWIPLLPWAFRIAAGIFPFQRTAFDIPVLVFFAFAFMAAWISYDQLESWAKFWLVLTALLVFYALANQPPENYWLIARVISVIGFLLSIYFLLSYDWQKSPVKIEAINRIGRSWMEIRPSLSLPVPDLDSISGTLFLLLPFPIALLFRTWQKEPFRWSVFLVFTLFSFALVISLVMAALTEAGITVLAGVILVAWWKICEKTSSKVHLTPKSLFLVGVIVVLPTILWLFTLFPEQIISLSKNFPVLNRVEERLIIARGVIENANDFPLTGAGLASFPGIYSKYILVIPFFYIPNAYNLFLEILFEVGYVGFWAFVAVLSGVFFSLLHKIWRGEADNEILPFTWAVLVGFWVVLIIGLFDVVLFSDLGTIFLFVLPGLGVALLKQAENKGLLIKSVLPVFIFLGGTIWTFWQRNESILVLYYANKGAVIMAQVDLKDWPWDEGEIPSGGGDYQSAIILFEKVLDLNEWNKTALHRLGLVSMYRQDYQEAVKFLERAYQVAPGHRGIQKNLGYSYVWLGDMDKALLMLEEVPEAAYELEVYSWWWGTQNREDLSNNALRVANLLISQKK